MEVERVQRWISSALVMTVAALLASGLAILSSVSQQAGARPGLLIMSAATGLVAMVGVRLINAKRIITPWLAIGLLPALVVGYLTR